MVDLPLLQSADGVDLDLNTDSAGLPKLKLSAPGLYLLELSIPHPVQRVRAKFNKKQRKLAVTMHYE